MNIVRQRNTVTLAFVIAIIGAGSISVLSFRTNSTQRVPDILSGKRDERYKQVVPAKDPERRQEKLGTAAHDKRVDMTAFIGMTESYSELVSQYVESILSAIRAVPITRRRSYHQGRGPTDSYSYPDFVNLVFDRDVIVPLVILPRPDVVRNWSASTNASSLGWLSEDEATKNRGSVYGRTLIFEPGKLSGEPVAVPASPFETYIHSWDLYTPDHDSKFFRDLGKLVMTPSYHNYGDPKIPSEGGHQNYGDPKDESAVLQIGKMDGAKLLGEFIAVPAYLKNQRLRWVSILEASKNRRFLAYSLLDGNGQKRAKRIQASTSGPISPYVRPLACEGHQPKIKQHDELLLPAPLGWPPSTREYRPKGNEYCAHEDWCLDDWFPAQKDACWVIREAENSKPLQESFLLMPAVEKSDRPVFFIALFAETEPKQLIEELAALYNVSANTTLDSPETMQRLNSLYEKVRDFPLGK